MKEGGRKNNKHESNIKIKERRKHYYKRKGEEIVKLKVIGKEGRKRVRKRRNDEQVKTIKERRKLLSERRRNGKTDNDKKGRRKERESGRGETMKRRKK